MKISITKESKRVLTLDMMGAVNKLIADCKEDTMSVTEYAAQAVRMVARKDSQYEEPKVYEATARIAKNARIWNFHSDDSEDLDVWIDATAKSGNTIYIVGIYLSDIYQITGRDEDDEIIRRMFIQRFKLV